nr:DUF1360 domain-containing protein [Paenibacillus sp. GSMTC-2017]
MKLIVLILACYRLTRLIVFDDITSFLRKPFLEEQYKTNEDGKIVAVIEEKGGVIRAFFRRLVTCYWCVGIWSSIIVVIAYVIIPSIISPVLLVLAIAGAAGVLESFVKG